MEPSRRMSRRKNSFESQVESESCIVGEDSRFNGDHLDSEVDLANYLKLDGLKGDDVEEERRLGETSQIQSRSHLEVSKLLDLIPKQDREIQRLRDVLEKAEKKYKNSCEKAKRRRRKQSCDKSVHYEKSHFDGRYPVRNRNDREHHAPRHGDESDREKSREHRSRGVSYESDRDGSRETHRRRRDSYESRRHRSESYESRRREKSYESFPNEKSYDDRDGSREQRAGNRTVTYEDVPLYRVESDRKKEKPHNMMKLEKFDIATPGDARRTTRRTTTVVEEIQNIQSSLTTLTDRLKKFSCNGDDSCNNLPSTDADKLLSQVLMESMDTLSKDSKRTSNVMNTNGFHVQHDRSLFSEKPARLSCQDRSVFSEHQHPLVPSGSMSALNEAMLMSDIMDDSRSKDILGITCSYQTYVNQQQENHSLFSNQQSCNQSLFSNPQKGNVDEQSLFSSGRNYRNQNFPMKLNPPMKGQPGGNHSWFQNSSIMDSTIQHVNTLDIGMNTVDLGMGDDANVSSFSTINPATGHGHSVNNTMLAGIRNEVAFDGGMVPKTLSYFMENGTMENDAGFDFDKAFDQSAFGKALDQSAIGISAIAGSSAADCSQWDLQRFVVEEENTTPEGNPTHDVVDGAAAPDLITQSTGGLTGNEVPIGIIRSNQPNDVFAPTNNDMLGATTARNVVSFGVITANTNDVDGKSKDMTGVVQVNPVISSNNLVFDCNNVVSSGCNVGPPKDYDQGMPQQYDQQNFGHTMMATSISAPAYYVAPREQPNATQYEQQNVILHANTVPQDSNTASQNANNYANPLQNYMPQLHPQSIAQSVYPTVYPHVKVIPPSEPIQHTNSVQPTNAFQQYSGCINGYNKNSVQQADSVPQSNVMQQHADAIQHSTSAPPMQSAFLSTARRASTRQRRSTRLTLSPLYDEKDVMLDLQCTYPPHVDESILNDVRNSVRHVRKSFYDSGSIKEASRRSSGLGFPRLGHKRHSQDRLSDDNIISTNVVSTIHEVPERSISCAVTLDPFQSRSEQLCSGLRRSENGYEANAYRPQQYSSNVAQYSGNAQAAQENAEGIVHQIKKAVLESDCHLAAQQEAARRGEGHHVDQSQKGNTDDSRKGSYDYKRHPDDEERRKESDNGSLNGTTVGSPSRSGTKETGQSAVDDHNVGSCVSYSGAVSYCGGGVSSMGGMAFSNKETFLRGMEQALRGTEKKVDNLQHLIEGLLEKSVPKDQSSCQARDIAQDEENNILDVSLENQKKIDTSIMDMRSPDEDGESITEVYCLDNFLRSSRRKSETRMIEEVGNSELLSMEVANLEDMNVRYERIQDERSQNVRAKNENEASISPIIAKLEDKLGKGRIRPRKQLLTKLRSPGKFSPLKKLRARFAKDNKTNKKSENAVAKSADIARLLLEQENASLQDGRSEKSGYSSSARKSQFVAVNAEASATVDIDDSCQIASPTYPPATSSYKAPANSPQDSRQEKKSVSVKSSCGEEKQSYITKKLHGEISEELLIEEIRLVSKEIKQLRHHLDARDEERRYKAQKRKIDQAFKKLDEVDGKIDQVEQQAVNSKGNIDTEYQFRSASSGKRDVPWNPGHCSGQASVVIDEPDVITNNPSTRIVSRPSVQCKIQSKDYDVALEMSPSLNTSYVVAEDVNITMSKRVDEQKRSQTQPSVDRQTSTIVQTSFQRASPVTQTTSSQGFQVHASSPPIRKTPKTWCEPTQSHSSGNYHLRNFEPASRSTANTMTSNRSRANLISSSTKNRSTGNLLSNSTSSRSINRPLSTKNASGSRSTVSTAKNSSRASPQNNARSGPENVSPPIVSNLQPKSLPPTAPLQTRSIQAEKSVQRSRPPLSQTKKSAARSDFVATKHDIKPMNRTRTKTKADVNESRRYMVLRFTKKVTATIVLGPTLLNIISYKRVHIELPPHAGTRLSVKVCRSTIHSPEVELLYVLAAHRLRAKCRLRILKSIYGSHAIPNTQNLDGGYVLLGTSPVFWNAERSVQKLATPF